MDVERKLSFLKEAFDDQEFQDELKKIEAEIKGRIKEWLDTIPPFDEKIGNVFTIQSRVKKSHSFEEKLYRKNYIYDWDVTADRKANQEMIKISLPDILGFRINCYFVRNEKLFYDKFKTANIPDFKFDFTENTKQKNNHDIWKFSGVYKGEIHFEIQIKSIVHDIWGEVEHKTIYKNPNYDSFLEKKEELSSALYDLLFASDRELYSIFTMGEDEKQLVKSLFFTLTKDVVANTCKTDVLAVHYVNYFNTFDELDNVKEYISSRWIDALGYTLKEHQEVDKVKYERFKKILQKEFPLFYLDCIYQIDKLLYADQGFDNFIYVFLNSVYPLVPDDFYGNFAEIPDETDDTEEKPTPEEKATRDFLVRVNDVLSNCIINKKLIQKQ